MKKANCKTLTNCLMFYELEKNASSIWFFFAKARRTKFKRLKKVTVLQSPLQKGNIKKDILRVACSE